MQEGTKVLIDNEVYVLKRKVIGGYFAELIRTREELFISSHQLESSLTHVISEIPRT